MGVIGKPWYVKAAPDSVDASRLFDHLYDKYVAHYNKNNVKAQADFASILSNFDERVDRREKLLKYEMSRFKSAIKIHYHKKAKISKDFYEYSGITSIEDFEEKQEEIFELVENRMLAAPYNLPLDTEELYKNILNRINELHEAINPNNFKGSAVNELLDIFSQIANLKRIDMNVAALNRVSDNILESNYPEKLQSLGEMAEEEREEIRKEVRNIGGRPPDFDIDDTEKWFIELRKKAEYQRSKDKPNISKITLEIRDRHENKTGERPSESTIKNHRRELDLMQN